MTDGPLAGLKVLELGGIGPVPLACMLLADLGADVIRIDRARAGGSDPTDYTMRSRRILQLDLKHPTGVDKVLELVDDADVLIEGFRPGVAERLGLGPEECTRRNPRIVYGRMTGWGQEGPRAGDAGHDINYIALTGVLENIGRPGERPVPPLNLVGDYGGGSMFLLFGVLAAIYERQTSGRGQVVDSAMCDGVSVLASYMWSLRGAGLWSDMRGHNPFDGSAANYDTYECADGRHVAVGCLEEQFLALTIELLGLDLEKLPPRSDPAFDSELRAAFTAAFAAKEASVWGRLFEGTDACVTPVLSFGEALHDPHLNARGVFMVIDDVPQPRPAPRFSRTEAQEPRAPRHVGSASWHARPASQRQSAVREDTS